LVKTYALTNQGHGPDSSQRQTCKACWRPDKFDFHVPDDVWNRVVPAHLRDHVVCLYCFDEFAREAGEPYADSVKALYFAGDRGVLTFEIVRAVDLPAYD
jgi:hypothetical protein